MVGMQGLGSRPAAFWFLPLIGVIAAFAYEFMPPAAPATLVLAIKMTLASAMALQVAIWGQTRRVGIVAALTCHALGDGLLNMNGYLLYGMAMFFLGHLGYIATFTRYRVPFSKISFGQFAWMAIVFIGMLAMTWYVWPYLAGVMRWAAPVYAAALTLMAVYAFLGDWNGPLVPCGAMLFVVSDAALGLRLFAEQPAFSDIVWPTYAVAQLLIPLGFLASEVDRKDERSPS